jgi:hypothetical protein
MDQMGDVLVPSLHLLGRRLRLCDGHRLATRSLWLPPLAAALILLLGRLRPLPGHEQLTGIPLIPWALIVLGYSLLRPLPPINAARRVDAALALSDRLATALEMAQQRGERFDAHLVARQKQDALDAIRSIDPVRSFPLRWSKRHLALAAGCMTLTIALALLPNPMDAILTERTAIATVTEEQAKQLEKAADKAAQDASLDPADQEALTTQLRDTADKLRANPGDRERALTDLAGLEESLRSQIDPQSAARQAALDGLASDLAAIDGMEGPTPSLTEAADLLEEMAAQGSSLSPVEREAMAEALEKAARRVASTDTELAGDLSQLAKSIRDDKSRPGRSSSASASAQSAANRLRTAAADAALQRSLGQALNRTQGATQALAQAGRDPPAQDMAQWGKQGQQSGQTQGNSRDRNDGQNQQEGTGDGQGQQESAGDDQGQQGDAGDGLGLGDDQGQQKGAGDDQGQGDGQNQQGGAGDGQGQQESAGDGRQGNQGQQGGRGGGQGRGSPSGRGTDYSPVPQGERPDTSGRVDPDEPIDVEELETVFAPWQEGEPGDPDFVPGRQADAGQGATQSPHNPQPGAEGAALVPYADVWASYAAAAAETMEREYVPVGLKEYVRDYFTLLEP